MNDASLLLLFRADADDHIGTGHVMRCMALASTHIAKGGRAAFGWSSGSEALELRLKESGIPIYQITSIPGSPEDARQTVELACALGAAWVVADGYQFTAHWQAAIKTAGVRLLCWDDYGHAQHYHADLVLNQNAAADPAAYANRDDETRLLLGSRFACLRAQFLECARVGKAHPDRARKILVTLGGSDHANATAFVLKALAQVADIEATVVVGGSNPNLPELTRIVDELGHSYKLVVDSRNMPELMAQTDLAVSAAGSTTLELAFMGVPSVLLVTADNQRLIAKNLSAAGAALYVGELASLTIESLRDTVSALIPDVATRNAMGARGQALVDGHGARRVLSALGAPLDINIVADADSWSAPFIAQLQSQLEHVGHVVHRHADPASQQRGDLALFLSLGRIVTPAQLRLNAHNLVVHASALPKGRGWSPMTWQILEGAREIPVTLFEAGESVDSGDIYGTRIIHLIGNEVVSEIRNVLAKATNDLCMEFVIRYPFSILQGKSQEGQASQYHRRRHEDSRLDPYKTIAEQFDLLRVADPERYPAFFEFRGRQYTVQITPTTTIPPPTITVGPSNWRLTRDTKPSNNHSP